MAKQKEDMPITDIPVKITLLSASKFRNKKVYIYSVNVNFQRKWQIFHASSVNDTTSLGVQDRYLHMRSNVTKVIFWPFLSRSSV